MKKTISERRIGLLQIAQGLRSWLFSSKPISALQDPADQSCCKFNK